jgi:hypothetical protein
MPLPTNDTQKFTITQGDRLRLPQGNLEDSEGNPVNLAGCTVTFRMVDLNTGDVAVNDQPALKLQTDGDQTTWGKCTYVWQAGDTLTPGIYRAWFIVTAGGLSTSFPPDGDWYILIVANT